jgi:hypothetical protein
MGITAAASTARLLIRMRGLAVAADADEEQAEQREDKVS